MPMRRGDWRTAARRLLVVGVVALALSPGLSAQTGVPPDAGASNIPPAGSITERDQMVIVGSQAMAPYVDVVIDALQREYVMPAPSEQYQSPKIGFKLFCAGVGPEFPDIVASMREMRKSELDACNEHGVGDIIEIKIARSALVVVTKKGSPIFDVTPRMFYLGLAAQVPVEGNFVPNPFRSWKDLAKTAPDLPIRAIIEKEGGEREYFNDNFLEGGCRHLKAIDAIFAASPRVEKCTMLRGDGYVTELSPNFTSIDHHGDIDQRLLDAIGTAPQGTLAVFLWPHYWLNRDMLDLLPVAGLVPDSRNVRDMSYAMTTDLRFYFKRAHMRNNEGKGVVRGLREFMHFITREKAAGEGGAFEQMGLIALPDDERAEMRRNARTLRRFSR
jgi:phosphate transport system substrate-binding protein